MKTSVNLAALALLSVVCLPPSAFSQGGLTPPGAPAPTMKTLAQIEPRTAITNSSTAVTLSQPGSYYLTTNLTISSGNAITISASGVTLDLNGFTISSTAASAGGFGILLAGGLRDITIYNGHIRGGVTNNGSGSYSGTGFAAGIYYSVNPPANVLVSRVSVTGCLDSGIRFTSGDSTVVEACTVRTVGSYGIIATTIKTSSAIDCGLMAIYGDQVSDCRGESQDESGSAYGVFAVNAQNCTGSSIGGIGLYAATAQNCAGSSSASYGLYASRSAMGCYGSSTSGTGLYARTAAYCVGWRTGGTAIQAIIANGCYANSGTNNITHKYNMP